MAHRLLCNFLPFPSLSLACLILLGVGSPTFLVAESPTSQARNAGRHGFHADGRPWLWPLGAREMTPGEKEGAFRRQLMGEQVLRWTLDRGEADLEFLSTECQMDPSLFTSEVRVRVTYANGESQNFPTRAILGIDRNWAWGATRIPDGMVVETILPADPSIKRIQLIDHQGTLAWEAETRGDFFTRRPGRSMPDLDKDFVPAQAKRAKLNSDRPAQGQIDSRVEARREIQNAHIKAGIYPPYEIVLYVPASVR